MAKYLISGAFYVPSESQAKVLSAAKKASKLAGVTGVRMKQGRFETKQGIRSKYIECTATPASAKKLENILHAAGFPSVKLWNAKNCAV